MAQKRGGRGRSEEDGQRSLWAAARGGTSLRPDLYRLFYPLGEERRKEWAEIVGLPVETFASKVEEKATELGLKQVLRGQTPCWLGPAGNLELMLFRVPDPGDLTAVRAVFAEVAEQSCPLAYVLVNQRRDRMDAWDEFQLSRLSYLCHCNRLSGPWAGCSDG